MLDVNSPTSVALFKKQALEKGYKPEEVDSYLQQKQSVVQPSAIANNPLVQVTKNIPIVGSVVGEASGLVDRAVRKTGEAGAKLAIQNSPEYKRLSKKADDGTMTGEEALRFEELNKPLFLSQNETERLSNPVTNFTDQSKDLAATAAFAIPGAKTVPGAAAVGAGRAMLGSYGTSEKELNDPTLYSDVISSAPTGALLEGGLTYAGNKITNKLKQKELNANAKVAAEKPLTVKQGGEPTAKGKEFAQQFEVRSKIAERLKPWEVSDTLANKYGIAPDELSNLKQTADSITGKDGILNKQVRDSIAKVPEEIDVGEVPTVVKNLLDNAYDMTEADKALITRKVNAIIKPGKRIGYTNPLDAFDATKSLEKEGYNLLGKSTALSPNPRYEEMGGIFLDAADEIKTSLSNTVDKYNAVSLTKSKAVYDSLAKISQPLADEYMNAIKIGDLRAMQEPFVKLGKMVDETRLAQNTAFSKAFKDTSGASITEQIGNATRPVTQPVSDVVNKGLTKIVRPIKHAVASAVDKVQGGLDAPIPQGLSSVISKIPEAANLGLSMEQPSQAPSTEPSTGLEISNATGQDVESYIQERTGFKPLTLSNVIKLAGGNKANYDMLKQIYDEQQKVRAEYGKTVGGQNTGALAMVGLAQQKFNELQAKGLTGVVGGQAGAVGAATQLSPESRVYKDMILAIITPIARALGEKGVISDRDIPRYAPLLPPLNSTPEVARQKWDDIKYLIQASSKSAGMTSTDLGNASQVAF